MRHILVPFQRDTNGASTSKADDDGGDAGGGSGAEDLQLAFEVAEMARLAFERDGSREEVTPDLLAEVCSRSNGGSTASGAQAALDSERLCTRMLHATSLYI